MVARTKPVTVTVARRIQKSSGVRLMFFHDRCTSTRISFHHGFANVHTVSAFVLCCDTMLSILDLVDCGFALRPAPPPLAIAMAAPLSPNSSAVAAGGFILTSQARQYSTRVMLSFSEEGLGSYLHDVSRNVPEEAFAKLIAVQRHAAFHSTNSLCKRINERGFSRAAGSHDGQKFAISSFP